MTDTVKASDLLIKGLINEVLLNAAEAEMIALFPFLGLPVIKNIFHYFASKYSEIIAEKLAIVAAFKIIDAESAADVKAYNQSVNQLQEAIKKGDPNEAELAKEEFKRRLAKLIHLPR